jgi:L-threonylcarbamoyladenylate synthase
VLLRPGRIGRDALESVLGEAVVDRDADAPRASGTLPAHYQPDTPVELVATDALEARLAAGDGTGAAVWSRVRPHAPVGHWEEAPATPDAYEAAMYDTLRRFDRLRMRRIVLESPVDVPGWEAVHDRLARAAHRG